MALTLGDNFSYQGAKPLDARLTYATIAEMKAKAESTLYDGIMAYCKADGKNYQWKSTNEVDATLGKWREFESGGGAEYTAGDGIDITDGKISTKNMLPDDMAEVASPMPGVMSRLPVLFDESGAERVVGWYKYADGTKKPVYEKSFVCSYSGVITDGSVLETFTGGASNIDSIIYQRVFCFSNNNQNKDGSAYNRIVIRGWNNDIVFEAAGSLNQASNIRGIIRYTKTTDTAS